MASQSSIVSWPDGVIHDEDSHGNHRNYEDEDFALSVTHAGTSTQLPQFPPFQRRPKLECPVFMYEKSRNIPHSCNGLAAHTLSEVRRHLVRPHRGGKSHLDFLKRCPTCKSDVISPFEFERAHGEHGELCDHPQKQRRGIEASLVEWEQLYRKLYPGAKQVPTPYIEPRDDFLSVAPLQPTHDHDIGPVPSSHPWEHFGVAPSQPTHDHDIRIVSSSHDWDHIGVAFGYPRRASPTPVWLSSGMDIEDDTAFTIRPELSESIGDRSEPSARPHSGAPSEQEDTQSSSSLLAGMVERDTVVPQLDHWLQEPDPWYLSSDISASHARLGLPRADYSLVQTRPSGDAAPPIEPPKISDAQSILPPTSDTPDDLRCPSCHASFNGTYRRGNLSRHIRVKHGFETRPYVCEADGCSKVYHRQDARLKHYRKQHPGLAPPVSARRR